MVPIDFFIGLPMLSSVNSKFSSRTHRLAAIHNVTDDDDDDRRQRQTDRRNTVAKRDRCYGRLKLFTYFVYFVG